MQYRVLIKVGGERVLQARSKLAEAHYVLCNFVGSGVLSVDLEGSHVCRCRGCVALGGK